MTDPSFKSLLKIRTISETESLRPQVQILCITRNTERDPESDDYPRLNEEINEAESLWHEACPLALLNLGRIVCDRLVNCRAFSLRGLHEVVSPGSSPGVKHYTPATYSSDLNTTDVVAVIIGMIAQTGLSVERFTVGTTCEDYDMINTSQLTLRLFQ